MSCIYQSTVVICNSTIYIYFQCPKMEAVSILGGLTCFPNHFNEFQVLDTNIFGLEKLQPKSFKVS